MVLEKELGISLSLLSQGTMITVHTLHSVYDLEVIEAKKATIFGGRNWDGSIKFTHPRDIIVHGSCKPGHHLKVDWLELEACMEFHDLEDGARFSTSLIKRLDLQAPDGSWIYSIV